MGTIRTAVVGVGHFGRFHAEKYASEEGAELIAVVDSDADRSEELATRLGTRSVADYRDLVGMVDAVSIAVPTAAHHPIARHFLDNGVHVLVEKPFTSTIEEADDLIARAREGGLVLQVGHLERFFCTDSDLFDLVTQPIYIEAIRVSPFNQRAANVGVVLDLMIHDIDLIATLVDAPIRSVEAVGAPVLTDHEDIVNARLAFENGCVATITASRIAAKADRRFRIFQPDSLLSIDLLQRRVAQVRKAAGADGPDFDVQERDLGEYDSLRSEIRSFLSAVAHGTEPVVTGEDGRDALLIAQQVVESLRAQMALIERHAVRDKTTGDRS